MSDDKKQSDADFARELFGQIDAKEAQRLQQAKRDQHAQGKEPFDLASLEAIYDTSSATGYKPARDVAHERFEKKYYLRYPDVRSIREFAERLAESDRWSN